MFDTGEKGKHGRDTLKQGRIHDSMRLGKGSNVGGGGGQGRWRGPYTLPHQFHVFGQEW